MSKNNNSNLGFGMSSFSDRPKSLTPSILGIANSHGVKLSLNMTSEDKKDLMSKLEEWRKARKDKLAARILSKQNQFDKSKPLSSAQTPKFKKPSMHNEKASKIEERQSVFERLYYNNNHGKTKKLNVSGSLNKQTTLMKANIKKSSFIHLEKPNKEILFPYADTDETSSYSTSVVKECEPTSKESFAEKSANLNFLSAYKSSETEEAAFVYNSTEKQNDANAVFLKASPEGKVLKSFSLEAPIKVVEMRKKKNPLRRSISMMFRQKNKNEFIVRRSFSAKNLCELDSAPPQKFIDSGLSTILQLARDSVTKEKTQPLPKSVSFLTPRQERSESEGILRNKLEDWLKKNGHPLEGYRHLRCFGIESGEKISDAALSLKSSLGSRKVLRCEPSEPDVEDKENVTPPRTMGAAEAVHQVKAKEVEDWLKELHRLVVELKYPSERCEEWLAAIRKKCGWCAQLPIYWECLAALHESQGDLKSAIEDYERAIIKGGEVDAVGDSLAQLFEKMVIEQGKRSKPKLEKGLDPKNIFKSTIIKFALQQKALKKLSSAMDPSVRQQLYVATPVRRSTRIQTPYKSTEEVTSLNTLTPELRKKVIFKPNESLLYGD